VSTAFRALPDVRGRGAVAYWLYERLRDSSAGYEWSIAMRRGYRMTVPRSSQMGWPAAFTGEYEDPDLDLVASFFEPGTLAVDVGANFGFYAVPLGLQAAQHGGRVLAVEPVPVNLAFLRRNLRENGLESSVDVLPVGLGDEPLTVPFKVETSGGGDAHAMLGDLALEKTRLAEVLTIQRLDDVDLPSSSLRCSVMKMDIQGFETKALAGAAEFVRRHRPVIYAEFSRWHMDRLHIDESEPRKWVVANDYRAYEVGYTRKGSLSGAKRAQLHPVHDESVAARGPALLLVPSEAPSRLTDPWLR
jgi:FkbM family methyltransferase